LIVDHVSVQDHDNIKFHTFHVFIIHPSFRYKFVGAIGHVLSIIYTSELVLHVFHNVSQYHTLTTNPFEVSHDTTYVIHVPISTFKLFVHSILHVLKSLSHDDTLNSILCEDVHVHVSAQIVTLGPVWSNSILQVYVGLKSPAKFSILPVIVFIQSHKDSSINTLQLLFNVQVKVHSVSQFII